MKTKNGIELHLITFKGKQYLPVAQRLIWFREEHPDWGIETDVKVLEGSCLSCATIRDQTGRVVATAHKEETIDGFPDYIEKSETGAIGRALALCGYGTQFCLDDLDEGKRIVDAPQEVKPKGITKKAPQNLSANNIGINKPISDEEFM